MKQVKLGIIGVGNMGTSHAKNVLEGKVPGLELAAVADRQKTEEHGAEKIYQRQYRFLRKGHSF